MTVSKYIEIVGGGCLLRRREAASQSVSVGELKHLLAGLPDETKIIIAPVYRRSKEVDEYQPASLICLSVVEEGKK